MSMESVNLGAEPAHEERGADAGPSDRQKIEQLLALFKDRRARDGREDPLDDEKVLADAARRIEEERAQFGWVAPAGHRDDLRDAA